MWLRFLPAVLLAASTSSTSSPADPLDSTAMLGRGWRSVPGTLLASTCLRDASFYAAWRFAVGVSRPSTINTLREALDLDAPAGMSAGLFAHDRRAELIESASYDRYRPHLLIRATWSLVRLHEGSHVLWATAASTAASDAEGFRAACGDEYVAGVESGVAILVGYDGADADDERRVEREFARLTRDVASMENSWRRLDLLAARLTALAAATPALTMRAVSHSERRDIEARQIVEVVHESIRQPLERNLWSVVTVPYEPPGRPSTASIALRQVIERRDDLLQASADLRYIDRNPIRAMLALAPRHWREFDGLPGGLERAELARRAAIDVARLRAAAEQCVGAPESRCHAVLPASALVNGTRNGYARITSDRVLRPADRELSTDHGLHVLAGDLFRIMSTADDESRVPEAQSAYTIELLGQAYVVPVGAAAIVRDYHPRFLPDEENRRRYDAVTGGVQSPARRALCAGVVDDAVGLVSRHAAAMASSALEAMHRLHLNAVDVIALERTAVAAGWDRRAGLSARCVLSERAPP